MFAEILHAAVITEQRTHVIPNVVRQVLHHFAQAVDLLDRRILADLERQFKIVDGVLLILVVQPDTLSHFVHVDRRFKPRADKFAFVVFAEIGNINAHFFHVFTSIS